MIDRRNIAGVSATEMQDNNGLFLMVDLLFNISRTAKTKNEKNFKKDCWNETGGNRQEVRPMYSEEKDGPTEDSQDGCYNKHFRNKRLKRGN
jgi:hypothetical protein